MLMARHELNVVSTKVLEQLNYPKLVVVVSKACHPRAGAINSLVHRAQSDTPPRRSIIVGICRCKLPLQPKTEGGKINARSLHDGDRRGCAF
jgi:hypothetical protein